MESRSRNQFLVDSSPAWVNAQHRLIEAVGSLLVEKLLYRCFWMEKRK